MATIRDPLERILKRLSPSAASTVQKVADPFLVAVGLLAWGARVATLSQAQKEIAKQAQAVSTGRLVNTPESPQGGNVATAPPVDIRAQGGVTPIAPDITNTLTGGNGYNA